MTRAFIAFLVIWLPIFLTLRYHKHWKLNAWKAAAQSILIAIAAGLIAWLFAGVFVTAFS